ncbi:hypothetical protein BDZ45DRAFT_687200 [Acephala macrosclerotiorum]|nr:hypothetical protein BDZ45DRAFT_687200 [Acephala macrosclerotiorum]
MATTTRTRRASTLPKVPKHPNLPSDALAPYSTFWSAINHAVLTKIRADAMTANGGDNVLIRNYIVEKSTEFDKMSGKVYDLMESLNFFMFLTHDLQAAAYDHFIWMVACDTLFKEEVPFPGDTKVWESFREWLYREMKIKVEEEFEEALLMREEEVEFPLSGEGLEDRYADGEDEDTDGGVRLIPWNTLKGAYLAGWAWQIALSSSITK